MKLVWVATLVIEFDVMHISDEVTVDGCCLLVQGLLVQVTIQNPQELGLFDGFNLCGRYLDDFIIFYF